MFNDKLNLTDLLGLIKNPNKIQDMMKNAQSKLAEIEVIGESGAGAVKITMNAQNYAKEVMIDDEIFKEGRTIVQELVAAAINDCAQKIEKEKEKMVGNMGGMMSETEKK